MEKIKCLTGFELKMIALITMTIDHIGAVLLPQYGFLRVIGRIAFPIYCFLLVEGYFHTKDIKKYILRLLIFAMISEVFFDMAFYEKLCYSRHQNVFFTLLIGLITIFIADLIRARFLEKNKFFSLILTIIILISGGMLADILRTDYSLYGVFIIFGFYIFRKIILSQVICMGYINGVMLGGTQIYALLAMPFIFLYNEKSGKYRCKWLFYIYYPMHLVVLYLIKQFGI